MFSSNGFNIVCFHRTPWEDLRGGEGVQQCPRSQSNFTLYLALFCTLALFFSWINNVEERCSILVSSSALIAELCGEVWEQRSAWCNDNNDNNPIQSNSLASSSSISSLILATFQVSITGGHRDLGPGLLLGFSHTLRHRSLTEDWSSKQIVLQNLVQISKRPVREEIHTGLMEEIRNHHYNL